MRRAWMGRASSVVGLCVGAGIALCLTAGAAHAQNPNEQSASSGEQTPSLPCVYDQLPTQVKLRFELAARVNAVAAAEIAGGARGPGFVEIVRRCGFEPDEAAMARAEAYWTARAARQIAALEADRAGANVETLELALLAAGPVEEFPTLAEEMMRLGGAAADGAAGGRVLAALDIYEEAAAELDEAQKTAAAAFLAAELVVAGLEAGAELATPEAVEQ